MDERSLNDGYNLKINSQYDKSRIFGYAFDGVVNNYLPNKLNFVVVGSLDD